MFDLSSIWLLMFFAIIIGIFWKLRSFAELARRSAVEYCKKHGLQLLSVAMSSIKPQWQNGVKIVVTFDLNYSPEGLTAKKGEIEIINGKVNQIYHWS